MSGGAPVVPDPERLARGWERRFVVEGARVEEMLRLYRELGFQAEADPLRPADVDQACADCRLVAALRFQVIYTRPVTGGA